MWATYRIFTAIFLLFETTIAASAQTAVTGAELLVDLDRYAGKQVLLLNSEVFNADDDGALVRSSGATFKIKLDGIDRETFRIFLRRCSGLGIAAECKVRLLVMPTGQRQVNYPTLTAVKIAK